MKKLLAMVLCLMLTISMLAACNNNSGNDQKASETPEATTPAADDGGDTAAQEPSDDGSDDNSGTVEGNYTIGVSQFAQHGSLDNCYEGFVEGLRMEGFVEGENLTIQLQNAEADPALANQIAQNYVASGVDLIAAIATPSAQSAYNAALDTEIPVIYTAVTDPVAAELASEDGMPVGNVTGSSDKLPVEAQLAMIREILPDAETIGIMYTTSEVNSEASIAEYEAKVAEYGFKLETIGVSSSADIPTAADAILDKVDCLNNLTDNTVVNALPTILAKANEKGIPVFGSEIEQVKIGCLASEGIDYIQLGIKTGQMAAKVLKGEAAASELAFEQFVDSGLYLNEAVAEMLHVEIADSVTGRALEVFTEISAE